MSTRLAGTEPVAAALRRQLDELRSQNEVHGGAAAERCVALSRQARAVDPSLACQALQLAYWAFMVRGLQPKARVALERAALLARRHGLPALEARSALMRVEMLMASGEHQDGFGALVDLVRSRQFRQLSVNDGVRSYFLLAWGCRLLEPGDGVETCLALVDARLRDHDAPLAPWFVLMRALLDLQRLIWALPPFETLLAGRVTTPSLLQASRRRLEADCRALTALDEARPENRHPHHVGVVLAALREAVLHGTEAGVLRASALLAGHVGEGRLVGKSHDDLAYLVASTMLGIGRATLAEREMALARPALERSGMWELQMLWPHLESVLAEATGRHGQALAHYRTYARRFADQARRMNTAVPRLLASIVELPGAAGRARDGVEPEYLLRAKDLLAAHPERIGMAELAEAVGVSDRALREAFRIHLRTSPAEYARSARLDAARRLVRTGALAQRSVADLAEQFGFSNPGRFKTAYRSRFGVNPADDQAG